MSKDSSSENKKIDKTSLDVFIDHNNLKKDCLACKLTGTFGLFGISVYMFMNASKQRTPFNRILINSLATGRYLKNKTRLNNALHIFLIIRFEKEFL